MSYQASTSGVLEWPRMGDRRPMIDCHSDLMIDVFRRRQDGERDVLRRHHLPSLEAGGVVACVCTCGGDVPALHPLRDRDPYENAVALLDLLHADVSDAKGAIAVAGSGDELRQLIAQGTFAIVPALEGASPILGDVARLVDLGDRGVRVIGLTWNSRNELATGLDSGDGGLTPLGVRLVEVMVENGFLIDLAHASPETFWDVATKSAAPLIVSHANAKAVWDHPRNLDDVQLQAVANSGGIIGLCLYPSFVGPQPVPLAQVLDHADYLLRRVGPESLAIGADFIDYAVDEIMADLDGHSDLYPDDVTFPEGLSDVSELQVLVRGLEDRGWSDEHMSMIGTTNALRILGAADFGSLQAGHAREGAL